MDWLLGFIVSILKHENILVIFQNGLILKAWVVKYLKIRYHIHGLYSLVIQPPMIFSLSHSLPPFLFLSLSFFVSVYLKIEAD